MFGWRTAFFAIGTLGALWLVLWWLATQRPGVLKNVHEDPADTQNESRTPPTLGRQIRTLFTHPGFWLLMLVAGTINPCSYFIADWIPKYLHNQRSFGLMTAGLMSAPIFLGTDLGNIGGGGLVKWLVSRGWSLRRARGATISLSAAFILPAVMVGYLDDAYVAIALLIVASTAIASITANYLAALQNVSFANVGLIAGILGMFGNIVGATLNPLIGRYVDATGHYHLVFVLLGIFPVVGLLALLTFDSVRPVTN